MKLSMLWRIVYNKENPVAVKNAEMRKNHAPYYYTIFPSEHLKKNPCLCEHINRGTSPQFGGHNRGSPYSLGFMILSLMFPRPSDIPILHPLTCLTMQLTPTSIPMPGKGFIWMFLYKEFNKYMLK